MVEIKYIVSAEVDGKQIASLATATEDVAHDLVRVVSNQIDKHIEESYDLEDLSDGHAVVINGRLYPDVSS